MTEAGVPDEASLHNAARTLSSYLPKSLHDSLVRGFHRIPQAPPNLTVRVLPATPEVSLTVLKLGLAIHILKQDHGQRPALSTYLDSLPANLADIQSLPERERTARTAMELKGKRATRLKRLYRCVMDKFAIQRANEIIGAFMLKRQHKMQLIQLRFLLPDVDFLLSGQEKLTIGTLYKMRSPEDQVMGRPVEENVVCLYYTFQHLYSGSHPHLELALDLLFNRIPPSRQIAQERGLPAVTSIQRRAPKVSSPKEARPPSRSAPSSGSRLRTASARPRSSTKRRSSTLTSSSASTVSHVDEPIRKTPRTLSSGVTSGGPFQPLAPTANPQIAQSVTLGSVQPAALPSQGNYSFRRVPPQPSRPTEPLAPLEYVPLKPMPPPIGGSGQLYSTDSSSLGNFSSSRGAQPQAHSQAVSPPSLALMPLQSWGQRTDPFSTYERTSRCSPPPPGSPSQFPKTPPPFSPVSPFIREDLASPHEALDL